LSSLSCGGIEHINLAKASQGTTMAYCVNLARLALAIVECPIELISCAAAQTIARAPEIGRARLIGHNPEHPAEVTLVDFPKSLATELKVVALLVDGPTAIAVNEDPLLHALHQFIE